ncbi:alpha/beta fold hydrolase [Nocardia uniformis]|uniref:Alpha/beta fold hydrolase n=1 Tax=Nocardia uniformis TaxID=53432 RepID=A0A849CGH1_9NOCA|nr:alpha/beta fold hydrolase [Nocardia uniformis]
MAAAILALAAPTVAAPAIDRQAPAVVAVANPGGEVLPCRPAADRPRPVVLIHGTMDDATAWDVLYPKLIAAGYCAYALTYGAGGGFLPLGGVAPVDRSATEIAAFIDQVLAVTGADRVELVGHSQGGLIAEYYAKNLGGAAKVHSEILLAPTTHGTDLLGLVGLLDGVPAVRDVIDTAVLPTFCAACADQEVGSNFIRALNSGPIAQPNVRYAVLATRDDMTNTPAGAASFIEEPGVVNQFVQDLRPGYVTHKDMPRDPVVNQWILEQLGSA